jgi:ParB-like chromosome segregation protein Spo0J
VQWAIEKLLPYARNARTHSDEQIAQVAASIVEFGWTNPILVGGDGVVIAGHARLAAARLLKMSEVPVIVLDHLTPTQRRALVLADNRLALSAGWDEEMLRVELESLEEDGFDLDLVGFTDDELAHLLADQDAATDGEDEVPETPGDPHHAPRRPVAAGRPQRAAGAPRAMRRLDRPRRHRAPPGRPEAAVYHGDRSALRRGLDAGMARAGRVEPQHPARRQSLER